MDINVIKDSYLGGVYVEISCNGIISTFVGVDCVYVGGRAGDCVCIRFCRCLDHVGLISMSAGKAEALIAEFKAAGVFREEDPFELGAA